MSSTKERHYDKEGVQVNVRPTKKRILPFLGAFLVAFLVLPLAFGLSRLTMWFDEETGILVAHAWFVSATAVTLVAIGVGLFHAKRISFVIKHVAVTIMGIGISGDLFTLMGFKHRFLDVVYVFGALAVWGSWMLYRIDVFRAKATGESGDSWGSLVSLARSRPKNIRTTDNLVSFDVEHGPGETHSDVKSGVTKLADAAGAITGRVRIVEGDRGGVTHVSWSMADAFAEWRTWPGPSHPGLSFAYPFRTAWYEDGEDEWFSFTPTFADLAKSMVSPLTDVPMGSFIGAAGITGSGKSGFFNGTAAEGLTRCDCQVIWVDAEKLMQNAGWCLDMLGLAAGNPEHAKILTRGLRGLAEFRVQLFGQAALDALLDPAKPIQGREWSPTLARELGEPAVLVLVDEADTIIRTKAWEWLATRGRSLGIFLCVGSPRVSTAEVSALLRSAIGMWKTFAQGDSISGMFTLPDDVRETVDVQKLRAQGLHYLTGAPGTDRKRWSILAREFKNDLRVLRAQVLAARSRFEPMPFSEESQRWMGDAWLKLRPEVLMAVKAVGPTRDGEDDTEVPAVAEDPTKRGVVVADDPTPTVDLGAAEDDEDDLETGGKMAVRTSVTGTSVDGDELAAIDNSAVDAGVAREAALVDLDKPFDTSVPEGERVSVPIGKPRPATEAEEREALDNVFRSFADDPRFREFGNQDVLDALVVHVTAATLSRRMGDLEAGERLMPPGLTLERIEGGRRGRWRIVKSRPSPRPRG